MTRDAGLMDVDFRQEVADLPFALVKAGVFAARRIVERTAPHRLA